MQHGALNGGVLASQQLTSMHDMITKWFLLECNEHVTVFECFLYFFVATAHACGVEEEVIYTCCLPLSHPQNFPTFHHLFEYTFFFFHVN